MASRSVLITGASRGIGAATAQLFAEQGDRVAVHCNTARDLAEEVRASLPGDGHTVVSGALEDPDAIKRAVDEAAEQLDGRIDVLVNNAAIFEAHPIDGTSYEEWQRLFGHTLQVNLVGAANATWCALQHMPDGGRIVNVSSRGAFRGEPGQPAYGASKAGLIAFGQSLAKHLGPRKIAVASVAPGFTETAMARDALEGAAGDARRAESPLNRVATPEEIARAIVFLASEHAEWATGSVLDLNGASYLRM